MIIVKDFNSNVDIKLATGILKNCNSIIIDGFIAYVAVGNKLHKASMAEIEYNRIESETEIREFEFYDMFYDMEMNKKANVSFLEGYKSVNVDARVIAKNDTSYFVIYSDIDGLKYRIFPKRELMSISLDYASIAEMQEIFSAESGLAKVEILTPNKNKEYEKVFHVKRESDKLEISFITNNHAKTIVEPIKFVYKMLIRVK